MKRVVLFSLLLIFMILSGCIQAPVVPPMAILYTGIEAPLDVDFNNTDLGKKEGEASCTSIMSMVAWGDCSTRKAAENGSITTIKHSDYKFNNYVLGFVQILTIRVYGD
ncbi:MAG TPA: TRL domain-containing protein [Thermodesulfovibrionia bacterium]|nr:TRL domain-containing protein [Thermodesulfovibrionia bacterium]